MHGGEGSIYPTFISPATERVQTSSSLQEIESFVPTAIFRHRKLTDFREGASQQGQARRPAVNVDKPCRLRDYGQR